MEQPSGKRPVGGPRYCWKDVVQKDLNALQITNWREAALDRDGWRQKVSEPKILFGSLSHGRDYSLDIRDVALEDDGTYQCQVSSGLNGEPPIRSRYAHLTVLVAPEPPRIIQGAFIDATEDQPVDIECVSAGGKPAAEITWVDGNQAVINKNVKNKVEEMPDGRFETRSVLRLTLTKEHHNQTITCQAQNTADRAYRMATVHIEDTQLIKSREQERPCMIFLALVALITTVVFPTVSVFLCLSIHWRCIASNTITFTTPMMLLTSVSTPKPLLPAKDPRVMSDKDLNLEVERRLRSLPTVYLHDTFSFPDESQLKRYNETCAPFPKIDDIVFDSTYWQTLKTSNGTFFFYGAYMDVRNTSWLGPTVRVLAVHDRLKPTLITHCQLWFEDSDAPIIVRNYEYQLIWQKHWGNYRNNVLQPYLMSCVLPRQFRHLIPVSVSLVEKRCDRATNNLRVQFDRPVSERKNFAVCVKGLDFLHKDLSVRLTEWIEFIRLMGAEHIFFYELQVHPNITKVLDHYSATGFVTVKPITLPGGQPNLPGLQHLYLKRKYVNKRQMEIIPYNDCLYRNLYEYRWIVLLDVDEMILPVEDDNWLDLMKRTLPLANLTPTDAPISSYVAFHTYFLDSYHHGWERDLPRYMNMLQHVVRTKHFTGPGDFVKAFHETDRVLTVHNHFPVQCLGGICNSFWIKKEHGRLHHYRSDCAEYIPKTCDEMRANLTRDTLIWRWRKPLVERTDATLRSLGFFPSFR